MANKANEPRARRRGGSAAAHSRPGRRAKHGTSTGDLIISKTRTKAAATLNVAGDFYTALDETVRRMITSAEERALNNGRRTLRPHDL